MKPELERDPIWRTIPCAKVYLVSSPEEIIIVCQLVFFFFNHEMSVQLPPSGDYGAERDHQLGTVGNDSGSSSFVPPSSSGPLGRERDPGVPRLHGVHRLRLTVPQEHHTRYVCRSKTSFI